MIARLICTTILLMVVTANVMSQSVGAITPNKSIATLGRVWGLLKYYHPRVATEKLDWDQVLTITLPKAEQSHNDSTMLTLPLRQRLNYIVANRNQQTDRYVHWNPLQNRLEFSEQNYEQMALPDQSYRLLGLIRYWNAIQYFHPAKYLLDRDWKTVLTDFVPKFRETTDTLAYQLVLRKLIGTIEDGHATLEIPTKYRLAGLTPALLPPFYTHIVSDTLLVAGLYNDSLCQLNGIRRGDRIVGIDGKTVSQLIDERSAYASASNRSAKVQQLSPYLLTGSSADVRLQVVRAGQRVEVPVKRYSFKAFGYHPAEAVNSPKVVPATIGYVDMGQLRVGDVKKLMNKYRDYKGIIFDVRTYPRGTFQRLSSYLNPHPTGFARYTKPDLSFPGGFKSGPVQYTGQDNTDYYKGKVAILCNSYTQSAAESTCMALRTAPNAKIIGSQSAGANGDVSYVNFPGGYETRFTGTGVYTVDGKPVQRNGVPIDIEVKPSCADVLSGTDRTLQTAIEWINQ